MKNRQITPHFSLYEFIQGTAMSRQAIDMNMANLHEINEAEMLKILQVLEKIRKEIELEFKQVIPITITSGFRCQEWEFLKGRGRITRHSSCKAVDFVPKCEPVLAVKILDYLYNKYNDRVKGWKGGFAIKKPTYERGKLVKVGFIHIDNMLPVGRWFY